MRSISKKSVAITAAVFTIAGSGVALAYWTQSGSGTGSAATGTTKALTITGTSPTGLVPGDAAKDVVLTISNPGDAPVKVQGVTIAIASTFSEQADADKPACTASDFTVVSPLAPADEIAAGATATVTGSIKLNNTAANQDNCKDVTVPLVFSTN